MAVYSSPSDTTSKLKPSSSMICTIAIDENALLAYVTCAFTSSALNVSTNARQCALTFSISYTYKGVPYSFANDTVSTFPIVRCPSLFTVYLFCAIFVCIFRIHTLDNNNVPYSRRKQKTYSFSFPCRIASFGNITEGLSCTFGKGTRKINCIKAGRLSGINGQKYGVLNVCILTKNKMLIVIATINPDTPNNMVAIKMNNLINLFATLNS